MADDARISLTQPGAEAWTAQPAGYRAWEGSVELGSGDAVWRWAREELLRWGVKTRSGFAVEPPEAVRRGDRPVIRAHAFGLAIREPVEVIEVVDEPDRTAFAYRTLPGHPIDGEEAFLLSRGDDGTVRLGIRSLTRPAAEAHWRLAYPGLLVAQSVARRRYLRALSRVRAGG